MANILEIKSAHDADTAKLLDGQQHILSRIDGIAEIHRQTNINQSELTGKITAWLLVVRGENR